MKITREEFNAFLSTLPREGYYVESDYFNYQGKEYVDSPLSFGWEESGASGGDCWGGEAHWYMNDGDDGARENFDKNLNAILEKFLPEITYLKVDKLKSMVKTGLYTNTEYYGNYSNHETITLSEDKLFDFINEELSQ